MKCKWCKFQIWKLKFVNYIRVRILSGYSKPVRGCPKNMSRERREKFCSALWWPNAQRWPDRFASFKLQFVSETLQIICKQILSRSVCYERSYNHSRLTVLVYYKTTTICWSFKWFLCIRSRSQSIDCY